MFYQGVNDNASRDYNINNILNRPLRIDSNNPNESSNNSDKDSNDSDEDSSYTKKREFMKKKNGIKDDSYLIRGRTVTPYHDFRVIDEDTFNIFNRVKESWNGYFGRNGVGEPNYHIPDMEERVGMYNALVATRDYMEKIDPNKQTTMANLLSTMSLDHTENQTSEFMAMRLRKIIWNDPKYTKYIRADGRIKWQDIDVGPRAQFMKELGHKW